jgi:hypothetical protein
VLDEKRFIATVEAAGPDEFGRIMSRPSAEEERALRAHLGDERYRRMHATTLRRNASRNALASRGNVVVIHDVLGSQLTATDAGGEQAEVWPNTLPIMQGQLALLRLASDGRTVYRPGCEVKATGILKRHYGELLLRLSQQWTVRSFAYDWRKDIKLAAEQLCAQLCEWFADDEPFHLVAHGMGGLVARTFIASHAPRWAAAVSHGDKSGGRLVMLGTPNQGCYWSVQVLAGVAPFVRRLALLAPGHNRDTLLAVVSSFVSAYQLLPSPLAVPSMAPLYRAETHAPRRVSQQHLDNALAHHRLLREAVDPQRMVCVLGSGERTVSGISQLARLEDDRSYSYSLDGDGFVSHELGLLGDSASPLPAYYADAGHGGLTSAPTLLDALDDLLESGATTELPTTPLPVDTSRGDTDDHDAALRAHVQRLAPRLVAGGSAPSYVTFDERQVEELVTRDVLSAAVVARRPAPVTAAIAPSRIELAVRHGFIDQVDELGILDPPIDAVAVGHYLGVKPQAAELALDRAISSRLAGLSEGAGSPAEADLLITQFSERGILRGELGQPFFLTLPPKPGAADDIDQIIAIAGMGVPGRFGAPELAVLARELCWSLGRMGRRHLATVLIGAGNGNLSENEAVGAWIRGVKYAVSGSFEDDRWRLQRITFVEADAQKIRWIQQAIIEEQRLLSEQRRLEIHFEPLPEQELTSLERAAQRYTRPRPPWAESAADVPPTRVTLELHDDGYRFGAITEAASIPERVIPVDPKLVKQANDELAAEWEPSMQLERGQFLERLIVPADLREQLTSNAPLVFTLDTTTARIHWELAAQSELLLTGKGNVEDGTGRDGAVDRPAVEGRFLGTGRGLTRQLRTMFAPPPEPPPPPRRILRVLVVADPAADAPLLGAQEEGIKVADLFSAFNTVYEQLTENRVQVVALLGPREATRTNVLRHLMLHSFDVLHFAGHCMYDTERPSRSGWIFSGGERVTANELTRIDRIPKFVFSNACESGITPDRSELRSVELAPSFAESFFARGVSNFVCTAWPVDDLAAREFALTLYAQLLGLVLETAGSQGFGRKTPEPMHVAMREARRAVATSPQGARTWGAYQHYGNPYLRFFNPVSMIERTDAPQSGDGSGTVASAAAAVTDEGSGSG